MIYALGDRNARIAASAWVAPDANVIGSCELGDDVSIWFGATLRGDTETIVVGRGTNVQDGCVLHSDPGFALAIGSDCTIGHRAILHGCTLEDRVLVGMGATILNGAHIGADTLIGAGALVTEGKVIPPGSLVVGAPARVVRELGEGQRAALLASARGYASRAAWYRDALRPLMGETSPS